MGLILDTNFIIAAEREVNRRLPGPAAAFLSSRLQESFYITFTVTGELACGQSASDRRNWEHLCRPYPLLAWSREISWHYGEIFRLLSAQGRLIGSNDLWIAATAAAHGHGVVTRNRDEFSRIPGLRVETF
jgi:predicted nucleic acid-binding protein